VIYTYKQGKAIKKTGQEKQGNKNCNKEGYKARTKEEMTQ
jgi:hypothetical protein